MTAQTPSRHQNTPAALAPAALAAALIALPLPAAEDEPPASATEQRQPVPRIISAPATGAPSDAIVLFDGSNVDAWEPTTSAEAVEWKLVNGALVVEPGAGDLRTQEAFGDIQLHLEFRTPSPPKGDGQDRANSGVLFMGRYELQILDSHENATYVNGQAGSVYKQFAPLVNASRPPGEWQTYDVLFFAPHPAATGREVIPARMTVFHNGVLVQNDVILRGVTVDRGEPYYEKHAAKLPLVLQEHGSAVAFRNIWVREIARPDGAGERPE